MEITKRPKGYEVKYLEDLTPHTKGVVIVYSKSNPIGYISYNCGNEQWYFLTSIDNYYSEFDEGYLNEIIENINARYEDVKYDFIKFV